MELNDKIRAVRKRLGLGQSRFAESIGMSAANLCNIENGRTMPSNTVLKCIAAVYNLPEEWLKNEKDEDFSVVNADTMYYAGVMDRFLRLEPEYRSYIEKQLDGLLELQGVEKKKRGVDNDEEPVSCS